MLNMFVVYRDGDLCSLHSISEMAQNGAHSHACRQCTITQSEIENGYHNTLAICTNRLDYHHFSFFSGSGSIANSWNDRISKT